MKYVLTLVLLLSLRVAKAKDEFQLGVIMGAPTGISAKLNVEKNRAIDAALAYALAHDLGLEFHADYLIEKARSFNINAPAPLELYYGIGAKIADIDKGKHEDDVAFGPRAPLGISYTISNPDLMFFGELALVLNLTPDTDADLDGGVGIRYRF